MLELLQFQLTLAASLALLMAVNHPESLPYVMPFIEMTFGTAMAYAFLHKEDNYR